MSRNFANELRNTLGILNLRARFMSPKKTILLDMALLSIEAADLLQLDDTNLRTLVALLCEAEIASFGRSETGVFWGGHQKARDGGLDVKVESVDWTPRDSPIPKAISGLQVKHEKMGAQKIQKEMRPKGVLRDAISQLAENKGAYMIVSGKDSCSEWMLSSRLKAMKDAVSDDPNFRDLDLRFIDSSQLASWLRKHPSLILWMRQKIGKPLEGWKAFENWTKPASDSNQNYLVDDKLKIRVSNPGNNNEFSANEGIDRMRDVLATPGKSIRLVGLSGVGKTRLAQALFEEATGERPLNKKQAFYTDAGFSQTPSPDSFARNLLSLNKRAFLVVDNCSPALHRSLEQLVCEPGSQVSLLTIEYDVKEDDSAESEFFHLEPSSDDLIEKIVKIRFPEISDVNTRTIAEFSNGNFRIALALAKGVFQSSDIGSVTDQDLLQRLVFQRGNENEELLKSAKALSLVYSFDVSAEEIVTSELETLSQLFDLAPLTLFRNLAELERRELLQRRGRWRALLPHAISNRFASLALEEIPAANLISAFENSEERLLKSFARRLSYLHDSPKAIQVATTWLKEENLLGPEKPLNKLRSNLLKKIAPLVPNHVLKRIGNELEKPTLEAGLVGDAKTLAKLLAYEPESFYEAATLLSKLSIRESQPASAGANDQFKALFWPVLSGTQASLKERLSFIKDLSTKGEKELRLSVSLFNFVIHHQTSYVGTSEYSLGARSRDFGWRPRNWSDWQQWYKEAIDFAVDWIRSSAPGAEDVKKILGNSFRPLWDDLRLYDEIESTVSILSQNQHWPEAFLTLSATIYFDGKEMEAEALARLRLLRDSLKPQTLLEELRLFAIGDRNRVYDCEDFYEKGGGSDTWHQAEERLRELGVEASKDLELSQAIVDEVLGSQSDKAFQLGVAMAEGSPKMVLLWDYALSTFKSQGDPKTDFLRGLLCGIERRDTVLTNEIVERASSDERMLGVFVELQSSIKLGEEGVDRLKRFHGNEVGSGANWFPLGSIGRPSSTSDLEFCELVEALRSDSSLVLPILSAFSLRFLHSKRDKSPYEPSESVLELAREFILSIDVSQLFAKNCRIRDWDFARICETILAGSSGHEVAKYVMKQLIEGVLSYRVTTFDCGETVGAISEVNPKATLDTLLELEDRIDEAAWILRNFERRSKSAFSRIPESAQIKWCSKDWNTRAKIVAQLVPPFIIDPKAKLTSGFVEILRNVENRLPTLEVALTWVHPQSWGGRLSVHLEKRAPFFDQLAELGIEEVTSWAASEKKRLDESISREREREESESRDEFQRFEYD